MYGYRKSSTSITLAAVGLALAASIAGCANTTDTANGANQASSAASPVVEPSAAVMNPAPESSPMVEMPAGPAAGTNAAVAWEALMGPEGEYAASASYAAVIDTFGQVEPYVTIRAAEERHIAALTRQLERMGIEVPDNPYLGKVSAPTDLQTAAQAWATGEVKNVEMYDVLLTQSTDANLTKVLTNLRRASLESHLPLFKAAAENGGTLTAQQMAAMGG